MKNELLFPPHLKKKITNIIGNAHYIGAIDFNKYPGFNELNERQLDDATEDVNIDLVLNSNYSSFKGIIIYNLPATYL